jgi:hypothetical protein
LGGSFLICIAHRLVIVINRQTDFPHLCDKSQPLNRFQKSRYIAEITSSDNKKAGPNDPAFWKKLLEDVYCLNFLLTPTIPIKPEPNNHIAPGMGIAVAVTQAPILPSIPPSASLSLIQSVPSGCLVADQLRTCTKTIESTGADNKKGLIPNWRLTLQKKTSFFAMEGCFFLTGAF